ncbi:MAG TPA: malonyl-ACP O-methyltransferase BioC [Gammaproteobacteria bacterium]|nr:malonyl-ACP O-methyltransferase BioC [Gammaproteobacteria bacterium]
MQDPDTKNVYQLDTRQVQRAFTRAASDYDAAAVLQREVRNRLLERLEIVKLQPQRILDVGCGTGGAFPGLQQRWPKAKIIGLDLAFSMLQQARDKRSWFDRLRRPSNLVCANSAQLPFAKSSVDCIFSSLMLQWCDDLDQVLREFRRIIKPNGLFIFASFGPDTLKELRAAWAAVDQATHVNQFIDMHDVGDALIRAGFDQPVLDVDPFTLTYPTARHLMRDLKQIGAHNVNAGRARGLTGKARIAAVEEAYAAFRDKNGQLPATYEVVYGTAWAHEFEMK